jgi:hypothetical protein
MNKFFTIFSLAAVAAGVMISCQDDDANSNDPGGNTPSLVETCLGAPLQDGLVAYFPFTGGTFNEALNNLSVQYGEFDLPTTDRSGNASCAVAMGPNESFLSVQDPTFLDGLTEMSVSMWYQPQGEWNQDVNDGFQTLISRDQGIHCPDTDGQWSISLYDGRQAVFGHGNSVWEMNENAITNNDWTHVVATWNEIDNSMKLYINGVLVNSDTGFADCGQGPVEVNEEGNLFIGRGFIGNIDDIAIYNRELSAAEAQQLFELDGCCAE